MANPPAQPQQQQQPPTPLTTRLVRIVKHPQFVWFIGHMFTAISIPFILLRLGAYDSTYYRALLGAIAAYGVVLYRHYKPTVFNQGLKATSRKMLLDLNAHYFGLALYFWLSPFPSLALLVPYTAFSVFHCLGYIKDMILPAIFPATASSPAFVVTVADILSKFSLKFQPQALHLASYWEVTVTPITILLELVTWNQSFFAPLVYVQFIAVRYLTSATTRNACGHIRRVMDARLVPWSTHSSPFFRFTGLGYIKVRDLLSSFLNSKLAS